MKGFDSCSQWSARADADELGVNVVENRRWVWMSDGVNTDGSVLRFVEKINSLWKDERDTVCGRSLKQEDDGGFELLDHKKVNIVKTNVEKPAAEQSDSLFRGVRKRKWGKYVSEIRLPNSRQRILLGSYDSAEKAARAFDAAMFCLRGSGARFNFPTNIPDIAGGRSMTHSEIQAAAACFSNSEPRNEYSG
ncbi:ethylene-responsive transcription factor ERF017-like [Lathyrus oleraceus]|uniref:ethylene-responsive transcription factor ERF017-like n=1 Tax=Pisum sativum TaxID=3888 RepID=UPI0021D08C39|nr:ethylene-responsive transcription factor ERF017-like [Pisum sativum]